MNSEKYKLLIVYGVFATLPADTQEFLWRIMSAPPEAINTQQLVEESAQEMEREVEVATLEVAKVLVEVPKSPRTLRPKPTPTKETLKESLRLCK